jgi:4-amino-4-deoxy-L-arabinose transferase-like glycosyltransferase
MPTIDPRAGRERLVLPAILVLAALLRLYHLGGPVLDGMSVKQVYMANKARAIARPPFNLLRNDFDFLMDDGSREVLTEEAPLYTGLVAAAYSAFGEWSGFGQAWSILASVVALSAFYGLIRREFDARVAGVATLLFAICPLFIFYGRAFQADASMLACMLVTCLSYRRYLDGEGTRWLVLAAVVGAIGAVFKFYGLMVLVPLAFMAYRARGWRSWFTRETILTCGVVVTPVLAWTILVFTRTPNPANAGRYFLWQMPELLAKPATYVRFFDRFAYKSCGPITGILIAIGTWAVATRRARIGPILGWTVTGVLFFFIMAPLIRRHDYYELMLLPAASVWAALGWQALVGINPSRGVARLGLAVLLAAVVIHSPLVIRGQFEMDEGLLVIAERVQELCAPGERFVIAGPVDGVDTIHASMREGWAWHDRPLASNWRQQVRHYRELGARYLVVYDNEEMTPEQLAQYLALVQDLPLVESRSGPWLTHGRKGTYWLLNLRPDASARLTNDTSPSPPG